MSLTLYTISVGCLVCIAGCCRPIEYSLSAKRPVRRTILEELNSSEVIAIGTTLSVTALSSLSNPRQNLLCSAEVDIELVLKGNLPLGKNRVFFFDYPSGVAIRMDPIDWRPGKREVYLIVRESGLLRPVVDFMKSGIRIESGRTEIVQPRPSMADTLAEIALIPKRDANEDAFEASLHSTTVELRSSASPKLLVDLLNRMLKQGRPSLKAKACAVLANSFSGQDTCVTGIPCRPTNSKWWPLGYSGQATCVTGIPEISPPDITSESFKNANHFRQQRDKMLLHTLVHDPTSIMEGDNRNPERLQAELSVLASHRNEIIKAKACSLIKTFFPKSSEPNCPM